MSKKLTDYQKQKVNAYKQGRDDEDLEQATGKRVISHRDGGGTIFSNKVDDAYYRGRDSAKN